VWVRMCRRVCRCGGGGSLLTHREDSEKGVKVLAMLIGFQ